MGKLLITRRCSPAYGITANHDLECFSSDFIVICCLFNQLSCEYSESVQSKVSSSNVKLQIMPTAFLTLHASFFRKESEETSNGYQVLDGIVNLELMCSFFELELNR